MTGRIELRDTAGLTQAYRIVDTLVLRTSKGNVFTIEVGETLLGKQQSAFGGKVTLQANPPMHIGFCEAASSQEVVQAAEELIANASVEQAASSRIPKPHIAAADRLSA
jgi:hypothetical protein